MCGWFWWQILLSFAYLIGLQVPQWEGESKGG